MSLTIRRRVIHWIGSRWFALTRRQIINAIRRDYIRKYAEDRFEGTSFDEAVLIALRELEERFEDTLDVIPDR